MQAEAEAARARAEVDAVRAQVEAERAARERAEAAAAAAQQQATQSQTTTSVVVPSRAEDRTAQKSSYRMRLLEQLNSVGSTRDTPRGLVVTIPDDAFSGNTLLPEQANRIAQVGSIVGAHPGLQVEVEGHADSPSTANLSTARAYAVRDALAARGLPASAVSARGMGDSRKLVSNASASGREENRRVEIVITGDAIGAMPFWDRAYSLKAQ